MGVPSVCSLSASEEFFSTHVVVLHAPFLRDQMPHHRVRRFYQHSTEVRFVQSDPPAGAKTLWSGEEKGELEKSCC